MIRVLPPLLLVLALCGGATADPATDYMLQCQGCHLADGSGMPGSVPALTGVARLLAAPGGRAYLVRVPGAAQSPLDDARLARLLTWLLHRFDAEDLPADFTPYTEEEVASVRRPPLTDVADERARLLAWLAREGAARVGP